jgi:hypothetical protein
MKRPSRAVLRQTVAEGLQDDAGAGLHYFCKGLPEGMIRATQANLQNACRHWKKKKRATLRSTFAVYAALPLRFTHLLL